MLRVVFSFFVVTSSTEAGVAEWDDWGNNSTEDGQQTSSSEAVAARSALVSAVGESNAKTDWLRRLLAATTPTRDFLLLARKWRFVLFQWSDAERRFCHKQSGSLVPDEGEQNTYLFHSHAHATCADRR